MSFSRPWTGKWINAEWNVNEAFHHLVAGNFYSNTVEHGISCSNSELGSSLSRFPYIQSSLTIVTDNIL